MRGRGCWQFGNSVSCSLARDGGVGAGQLGAEVRGRGTQESGNSLRNGGRAWRLGLRRQLGNSVDELSCVPAA